MDTAHDTYLERDEDVKHGPGLRERLRLPDDVLVVTAKRKQHSGEVRLEK